MNTGKAFEEFINNLRVKNRGDISNKYKNITKVLNKAYWDSESETNHCLQAGSFGRGTAINGISDLDMIFVLPWDVYERFNSRSGNGQSDLLQEVKGIIKDTYSQTTVRGDGQVVVIQFSTFKFEVVPGFEHQDGSFTYPDSSSGGMWRKTDPRSERDAINRVNDETCNNLKNLCKMVRCWKNHVGVNMNGLLVDTFCYNFLNRNYGYKTSGFANYDYIARDFFDYLAKRDENQDSWRAPGSGQLVSKYEGFVGKARRAYDDCCEAIENEGQAKAVDKWKRVFGRQFPTREQLGEARAIKDYDYRDTEEFIENSYQVDIRYNLKIDCEMVARRGGHKLQLLSKLLKVKEKILPGKDLKFYIKECGVEEPEKILWKVKNEGDVAKRKNWIRGEIVRCDERAIKKEYSSFKGNHYVECYIIKYGVCVARDRIPVPIKEL